MTLPIPQPLPNESPQAFAAFAAYVKLGKSRSLKSVARRLKKSSTICARWSRKHQWQRRLLELTALAAEEESERQRQADMEAKRKFAERIEAEKLRFLQRQIEASEKATAKALEILNQPFGDCRPPEAARLLAVAYQIGGGTLNLPGAVHPFGDLQPSASATVNLHVYRDEQSNRAAKIYHDFFAMHPEHPQSARFVQEYRDLVAELGHEIEDAPPHLPDGGLPDGVEQTGE